MSHPSLFLPRLRHDVLNPLGQIIGFIELAMDDVADSARPCDRTTLGDLRVITRNLANEINALFSIDNHAKGSLVFKKLTTLQTIVRQIDDAIIAARLDQFSVSSDARDDIQRVIMASRCLHQVVEDAICAVQKQDH
jgi:K+-sensing histidine kinase KdpD